LLTFDIIVEDLRSWID